MPSSTQPEELSQDVDREEDSPPPAAPTASTPGPRATRFQEVYVSALSTTLNSISYESFAACFPGIAAAAPESLKFMHKQFVERIRGFAMEEFSTIIHERNVIQNLNKLEDLITSARTRASRSSDADAPPTPPHLLPPDKIMHAHLDTVYTGQRGILNAKLQTTQSQNAELAKRLGEQRAEIAELMGVLERVVEDLDRAGDKLGAENGLGDEGRDAESILAEK